MHKFLDFDFWEMIWRTTGAFVALLVLARLLGRKQLSQLTYFHYITGIAFGSIAAEIAGQTNVKFMDGITALAWWALLTIISSYISLKSNIGRLILEGQPSIVVKDGALQEKEMRKVKLHLNDLMMMLREQSIFSIQDVHYAILESNGELSVLKKIQLQEATKQDVQAAVPVPKYIPSELISEGKFVKRNLVELNITEDWVLKELRKRGVESVEQVFFAQLQTDGSLYVDLKSKTD